MKFYTGYTFCFIILVSNFRNSDAVRKLGSLNVDRNAITISGFSSGGAQAMQFHIAHSSLISGVGIFSGVPYLYGYGRQREDFFVLEPDKFNTTFAVEMIHKYEKEDLVDPIENIKNGKVYIYHGTKDSTVYHGSGIAIDKIYRNFDSHIMDMLDHMPSEHGMPSDNYGGPCETINMMHYYVNLCGYNGVYAMFHHLYGEDMKKPNGSVGTVPLQGDFFSFDQLEFINRGTILSPSPGMDAIGFVYVPSGCMNTTSKACRFSIVLHGCEQSRELYGDNFAKTTGYLEMAELNDIILLFPQTRRSFMNPRNPSGCWDWMGFTGKLYATNEGRQIQAIRKMVARVIGEDES